jgi:hypothetical protein
MQSCPHPLCVYIQVVTTPQFLMPFLLSIVATLHVVYSALAIPFDLIVATTGGRGFAVVWLG